ncbi:MAG: TetR/AcrR family transcriptional regulator, partial [Lachnospiraceae bacterium]|nr:TetR/AcrR family transcriptional regulator [Lachnospiraceae bacterium]
MSRSKRKNTKYEILLCATKSFLERGYTDTYVTVVAKNLGISTGNLTFHYPTKEHILAEMMKELCAFQAQADAKEADKKYSLLIEYLF